MAVRRIFVEKRQGYYDVPAQKLRDDLAETFRLLNLKAVRVFIRYDVEGLNDTEFAAVRDAVFVEAPVDTLFTEQLPNLGEARTLAIEYLPGQFDQRASSAAECAQLVTQGERPLIRVAQVIALIGTLSDDEFKAIKSYLINPVDSHEASMAKPETLSLMPKEVPDVEILQDFNTWSKDALTKFHQAKGLAMSFEDLMLCQKYFRDTEKRAPTITEIRVIDTYWSDHCRHTTFTTAIDHIHIEAGRYASLFEKAQKLYLDDRAKLYPQQKRDVTLMDLATIGMKALRAQGLLADLDASEEINAASIVVPIEVDGQKEDWLLLFKNETHNHPTEIEPFGGAATCLGGAIRDPLSGRAYVYQAMRVTGAGDPRQPLAETLAGKLPQKKITLGAAQGFSSYGNQIGLATGQVREIYHEGYIAKRLEIGAVVGAVRREDVVRCRPSAGDIVILVGGRTGRDGIGGATGSSKAHTEASVETAGAEVQKGNPPTERKLQRLFRHPEVSRCIKRCNDFGAGGVAVAVGELSPGLTIDLDAVPKKYAGLDGTELAISESQERMAVVVALEDVDAFLQAAKAENLEATPIATVTKEPRLVMRWRGKEIVGLQRAFLDTNGVQGHTEATIADPQEVSAYLSQPLPAVQKARSLGAKWLANLADLNVTSQQGLAERFDSTVGALSVLMPFGGRYQMTPEEGMVAKFPVGFHETSAASAMAFGFDPQLAEISPFHGAVFAVVEAACKMACLGVDASQIRLTFQEYFERLEKDPVKWGKPLAALLGALWVQHALKIPAIGGKDSMSGTFENLSVPPTFVAFAVGTLSAKHTISAAFKDVGHKVYALRMPLDENDLPDFEKLSQHFAHVHSLAARGDIFAAMHVGKGGIAAAVTKMTLGNDIGFRFANEMPADILFAPKYGVLLLELASAVDPQEALADTQWHFLGETTQVPSVTCGNMTLTLAELRKAYEKPLENIFSTRSKLRAPALMMKDRPFRAGTRVKAQTHFAKPRVLIPVFPGTNCEYESARAFAKAGAQTETLVMQNQTPEEVAETAKRLVKAIEQAQIIMLPGGFSGGDEPDGSGKLIAATFRNPRVAEAVRELLENRDGLMLGICNGFQALIKLGLVPYGEIRTLTPTSPTLTHNRLGRHISRMVMTRVSSNLSPWLQHAEVGEVHWMPISHGEGRFVADREVIARLRTAGQIATQYVDFAGRPTMDEPFNPNGSMEAIEGITSPDGRVFGKMGHSERIDDDLLQNIGGEKWHGIFQSGVQYFL